MRAKEIGEKQQEATMPDLSDASKRDLLQSALDSHYKVEETSPIPRNIAIEEVFEAEIIYSVDGQSYKVPYQMDESGKPTFGDPEKVVKRTVYDTVESLRSAYQGLIQEVGKRNAIADAKRVKEIVRLCQELLSNEPPDEDEVKKAIKKVEEARAWVREQAITRIEDGLAYPSSAFAYTPDTNDPSGWALRLWDGAEVTQRQLNIAAASLSPGGYKGIRAQIPVAESANVKRRIRSAYRSIGIKDSDIRLLERGDGGGDILDTENHHCVVGRFLNERIHVFDVDTDIVQDTENLRQTSGSIIHLDRDNFRLG